MNVMPFCPYEMDTVFFTKSVDKILSGLYSRTVNVIIIIIFYFSNYFFRFIGVELTHVGATDE